MFDALWHDVRRAVRGLTKSPAFALIAICSIAIGVGANTAMFSLADGLLLRPLPVPQPGGIVSVVGPAAGAGFFRPQPLSYADYRDVRDRAHSFENLAA